MHVVRCARSILASRSAIVRRRPCSGSSTTPAHVHPTSWYSQVPALFHVFLLALVAFPASVSAAPWTFGSGAHGMLKRQGPGAPSSANNNNSQNNGDINMSIWLPILLITAVFALSSFIFCIRRCAARDAAATARDTTNQGGSNSAGGNPTRPRRRPQRTPSQISTKSLPAYMKEPGDQELVLFRGPSETEDGPALPLSLPTLTEDDDERIEMRGATFDVPLDRIESVDTMADASTTILIHRGSDSMPRPPELHQPATSHDRRRSGDAHSLDSVGSEAELLAAHQRSVSVDNSADPRGEAPSYLEAVSAEGGMTTISLNDPEPNRVSSSPPSLVAGRRRTRFSFLIQNPFSSHDHTNGASTHENPPVSSIRSESPAQHVRSGSALSRFSTRESHDSHHSRTLSRNNNNLSRSRSRSNSNLFRALHSHSPGLHAGSSTISLDSISAPLTHTATRAEFYAPKGGLMTAEQIKLITSREALERFGVPYGPDAVAAYSRLAEMGPPPDFESVAGEQPGGSGGGGSATEATADATLPRSTSPLQLSPSHLGDERAESRASTEVSFETAPESDGQAQIMEAYRSGQEGETDEPRTARPTTPRTARPLGVSGDHGRCPDP